MLSAKRVSHRCKDNAISLHSGPDKAGWLRTCHRQLPLDPMHAHDNSASLPEERLIVNRRRRFRIL